MNTTIPAESFQGKSAAQPALRESGRHTNSQTSVASSCEAHDLFDPAQNRHRNLAALPSISYTRYACTMRTGQSRAGCCNAKAKIMQVRHIAPTALQSHCTADMLIAPSKVPGLSGSPCPRSCKHRSPSTSLSLATSSIDWLISRPYSNLQALSGRLAATQQPFTM